MVLRQFFSGWVWAAITGVASLLSLVGVRMDVMLEKINKLSPKDIIEFVLLGIAIVSFLAAILIKNKKPDVARKVLKDIANATKEKQTALYSFREYGNSGVPIGETWEIWLKKFPTSIGRSDLDYYNLGDEFYLVDYSTGKEIPIPTGNKARTEKVGDTIRPGMVLRLMQKDE